MKICIAQQNYHIGNFEANTKQIVDAIESAKQQGADLILFSEMSVCGYPARDFVEDFQKDFEFQKKFYLFTANSFTYSYIGLNTKNKKLKDVRVRRALSHLIDVDKIVETVSYGLATRVNSFIHSTDAVNYAKDIPLKKYDLDVAKKLLNEAGWKDSNNDGVLDKLIDGKKVELEITLFFAKGSKAGEKIATYFQEGARKAGVKIIILAKDGNVINEEKDKRKFEMVLSGWGSSSPAETDPKQIWHTSADVDGGDNYVGFGNAASDAVIEKLRVTIDPLERAKYYKELQQMIDVVEKYGDQMEIKFNIDKTFVKDFC